MIWLSEKMIDKKYKVSIETKNSTKYYSMSEAEYDNFLYMLDNGTSKFIKIPGSSLFVNVDQIIYIYAREEKPVEDL